MFTGIIQSLGEIRELAQTAGDWRLRIASKLDLSDVKSGDSIAVSGVCLTVVRLDDGVLDFDVSNETMQSSALATMQSGNHVNLEKALRIDERLGGHLVSGHVDGIAELLSQKPDGRSKRLRYRVPEELSRYIAHKGSVSLDGVSLTVNEVKGSEFSVNIIPHTSMMTTMQYYQPGQKVNLEVDVISRYLERLLTADADSASEGVTLELLAKNGFFKSN